MKERLTERREMAKEAQVTRGNWHRHCMYAYECVCVYERASERVCVCGEIVHITHNRRRIVLQCIPLGGYTHNYSITHRYAREENEYTYVYLHTRMDMHVPTSHLMKGIAHTIHCSYVHVASFAYTRH
jgi:hypothetical protein